MKKLLELLGTIAISSSALPTIIATSPYQKQEKIKSNVEIKYRQENNLETLNRNKRFNNIITNLGQLDLDGSDDDIKKIADRFKEYNARFGSFVIFSTTIISENSATINCNINSVIDNVTVNFNVKMEMDKEVIKLGVLPNNNNETILNMFIYWNPLLKQVKKTKITVTNITDTSATINYYEGKKIYKSFKVRFNIEGLTIETQFGNSVYSENLDEIYLGQISSDQDLSAKTLINKIKTSHIFGLELYQFSLEYFTEDHAMLKVIYINYDTKKLSISYIKVSYKFLKKENQRNNLNIINLGIVESNTSENITNRLCEVAKEMCSNEINVENITRNQARIRYYSRRANSNRYFVRTRYVSFSSRRTNIASVIRNTNLGNLVNSEPETILRHLREINRDTLTGDLLTENNLRVVNIRSLDNSYWATIIPSPNNSFGNRVNFDYFGHVFVRFNVITTNDSGISPEPPNKKQKIDNQENQDFMESGASTGININSINRNLGNIEYISTNRITQRFREENNNLNNYTINIENYTNNSAVVNVVGINTNNFHSFDVSFIINNNLQSENDIENTDLGYIDNNNRDIIIREFREQNNLTHINSNSFKVTYITEDLIIIEVNDRNINYFDSWEVTFNTREENVVQQLPNNFDLGEITNNNPNTIINMFIQRNNLSNINLEQLNILNITNNSAIIEVNDRNINYFGRTRINFHTNIHTLNSIIRNTHLGEILSIVIGNHLTPTRQQIINRIFQLNENNNINHNEIIFTEIYDSRARFYSTNPHIIGHVEVDFNFINNENEEECADPISVTYNNEFLNSCLNKNKTERSSSNNLQCNNANTLYYDENNDYFKVIGKSGHDRVELKLSLKTAVAIWKFVQGHSKEEIKKYLKNLIQKVNQKNETWAGGNILEEDRKLMENLIYDGYLNFHSELLKWVENINDNKNSNIKNDSMFVRTWRAYNWKDLGNSQNSAFYISKESKGENDNNFNALNELRTSKNNQNQNNCLNKNNPIFEKDNDYFKVIGKSGHDRVELKLSLKTAVAIWKFVQGHSKEEIKKYLKNLIQKVNQKNETWAGGNILEEDRKLMENLIYDGYLNFHSELLKWVENINDNKNSNIKNDSMFVRTWRAYNWKDLGNSQNSAFYISKESKGENDNNFNALNELRTSKNDEILNNHHKYNLQEKINISNVLISFPLNFNIKNMEDLNENKLLSAIKLNFLEQLKKIDKSLTQNDFKINIFEHKQINLIQQNNGNWIRVMNIDNEEILRNTNVLEHLTTCPKKHLTINITGKQKTTGKTLYFTFCLN
ncbi:MULTISPECIES: hypothetical protein [unclassified Spiroplasma]|uniref:hypothetical protein n=1 Tax=unclassified Spiroplasma TaxID=2637901 RepID=UPI00313DCAFC